MIGVIVLILIILAVLYFLAVNNKLNSPSLTDSSPSMNDSSESVQIDPQTGQYQVKLNNARIKSMRVNYDAGNGSSKISKVFVAERPLTYNEIVEEGNRAIGNNCVFVGTILENTATGTAATATRTTTNFDVKQFKNIFIIFKNLEATKIKETVNMVRYESEGMSYFFIDPSTTSVPEIRDVSYPVTVYTTSPTVQQKLVEWGYIQINDAGSLFLKNHRSFRIQ
ncbi:odv-e25 [Sucra jujuba nucleopolyhedrovirus]|uniref:Odv-e25 n=1 Tax=Sucra jujuba nucleopolyhedrovirus TaxID=1563660 RepID=A0A097P910_9ABAC|nr:odv-e25 [Sucra jujuba nucleopolyhedrovirus]AIU41317.1 odv-e25 [Sucra jujuba nucleopolyhedrovirus]